MSNQPRLLLDCLTNTPWKQLTALLAAYQLPRTAQQTKAQVIEQLHHHLLQTATITSIIAQLDGSAQAALRALLAAAGALPVHTFEHRFGLIRPYRPWRKADATGADQPWRTPISTTETLWYLGLLYRDPPKPTPGFIQHYLIPAELVPGLRAHLALDQPTPFAPPPLPHPGRNGPLDHHLAIWLATVHAGHDGQGVAPVHGRWLPPTVVTLLCTRLGLDQAPAFTPIRSERHHPYLAFLHYLALAADLVVVTPTAFQLTPAAWAWLTVDAATRHRQLAAAWHNAQVDLAQPFAFRWEPLSPAARTLVMAQLTAQLAPPRLAVTTLVAQWRLLDPYAYLPGPRLAHWHDEDSLYDPLTALITGPLHWLGFITLTPAPSTPAPSTPDPSTLAPSTLFVGPPPAAVQHPASPCTMPKQLVNTILAGLQVQPLHLVQLAPFCEWTVTTTAPTLWPHSFTLSPPQIAQLAAGGTAPAQLLAALSAALGQQPNRRVISRLRAWAQPGQQLALRTLLVLEADTPDRLAQLRRHKLVRNRLGEVIAPNRIALNPADADALAQTLRTLGYYVEPPAAVPSSLERVPAGRAGDEDAAGLAPMWQWLFITLYQGLGQQLPLPLALSWTTRQAVRAQLTAAQQATAEAAAHQLLDRLQMALNGYLQLPLWRVEATPDAAPVIRTALDQGKDIAIRYAGPSDGHITTRTVTPYWIEERHGVPYLIGWCHLRQQERTFRLDRIEAIIVV